MELEIGMVMIKNYQSRIIALETNHVKDVENDKKLHE